MSAWTLQTSICTSRECALTYQSDDGLLGLQILSGGRKPDRRTYFIWGTAANAPDYDTEAEARAALAAQEDA